ncbi:MAG: riboflavin biosynthesis protein RibF [Muribaculaceae bacterium]|nr:riboflavin biosynthesis protein RibF [Muribaculaceae bacterium]
MALIAPERKPCLLMSSEEKSRAIQEEAITSVIMLRFNDGIRNMSARKFMEFLHDLHAIDCLVIGYDHRFGYGRNDSFDDYVTIGKEIGIDILRAPEYPGVSSSFVRELLSGGRVADAAQLLGRPYFIEGIVVSGKKLGRTIGFPTANIRLLSDRVIVPGRGVYVADICIDGEECRRRAMLNIGHRPTVDAPDAADTIEVHVIGYSADIYGHTMKVWFLDRLRSEQRFDSIESLRKQLQDARRAASAWL